MSSICNCLFGRKDGVEEGTYKDGVVQEEENLKFKEPVSSCRKPSSIEQRDSISSGKGGGNSLALTSNGSFRSVPSLKKAKSLFIGFMPKPWVDKLRPELRTKIENWMISFYHMDPRYQILTFFNLVAKQGADNMLDDMSDNDNTSDHFYDEEDQLLDESDFGTLSNNNNNASSESLEVEEEKTNTSTKKKNKIFKDEKSTLSFLNHIFNTTSILTVWRPTSNEAMRKMMIGEGVGKGLNIKGKSAKKGKLSAFVPFMQIHTEEDKKNVSKIKKSALLRVYFLNEEFRKNAITALTKNYKGEEEKGEVVKLLDSFVDKGMYGLEVKQLRFWKVYVLDQDITRGEDTDTGRPSTAGFQDGNLKTLKQGCELNYADDITTQDQFPVLMQLSDDNPLSPQYLVMAYEENNTVKPVLSDFDGFLMGWRREALWFGCTLPRDQEALMMWSLNQIQRILEQPNKDSWTIRWLDVLKDEAIDHKNMNIPVCPNYGYGDPKSYSIMEAAAKRLLDSGAVRHGSECFNYGFPQEIDDHFLLISDTLHPVPWKYVSVTELQDLLVQKINEGFVFPLNPKWILCDPGWKRVYDALMASNALYADMSLDVWFPRYSGIRKKIDSLYTKFPNGFQRQEATTNLQESATTSDDKNNNATNNSEDGVDDDYDTNNDESDDNFNVSGSGTEEKRGRKQRRTSFRTSLQQSSISGQAASELALLDLENFLFQNKIHSSYSNSGKGGDNNQSVLNALHSVREEYGSTDSD